MHKGDRVVHGHRQSCKKEAEPHPPGLKIRDYIGLQWHILIQWYLLDDNPTK